MARKPKTQPSPEAAAAVAVLELATSDEAFTSARRGRKPEAAAPSPELPVAAGIDGPATDDAGADAPRPGPAKTPGRRGPGRKPKPAAGAETVSAVPDDAAGPQGQASHQPEAEAIPSLTEDDAPAAVVSQAEAAADSGPAQPGLDPGRSAGEAAHPFPETGAFAPTTPAAHWDRTTDRVRFDWPAIERTAAQDGPNRGMAKLLVAARAEGARSRWPF